MITVNQIKNMTLHEVQKLYIDLKQIESSDKMYETAQRLITFIENAKGFEPAPLIEVKNISGQALSVHDKTVDKDAIFKILPWQYLALARFLELVNPKQAEEIINDYMRQPAKGEDVKDIVGELKQAAAIKAEVSEEAIAKIVAATIKALGLKAAALLLFTLLLFGAGTASAQNQTYVLGSPSVYNVVSVGGLYGGTNNIVGTNDFSVPVNVSTVITNSNWTIQNGLATNAMVLTTNTVSNIPGIVSLANYDMADIVFSYQLTGAGTGVGFQNWDYSDDLINWKTNALQILLQAAGTTQVTTNVSLTLFAPGYLRLHTQGYPSQSVNMTNIVDTVARKPYRTGP